MLTVYGRPDDYNPKCYQCVSVKRWLDTNGIEYKYEDVADHEEYLQSLGIRALPIVVARNGLEFGGFDVGKLQQIKAGN